MHESANRPARGAARRPDWWTWLPVWPVYAVSFLPAVWGFYLGATGGLGADPVKAFEHMLGLWTLRFLIMTLLVTPIRDIAGVNLIKYRRALGLMAFYYGLMHFSAYMILDQALNFSMIVEDIAKRPFITIGMAALALMVPLAVTSNSWSIRRLGSNWNRLHCLIYVIAAAGALHFIIGVKGWPAEPVIYAGIVGLLLAWRPIRKPFRRRRRSASPRVAPASRQPAPHPVRDKADGGPEHQKRARIEARAHTGS